MMLIKDQLIKVSFKYDPVFSPGSVRPFHPFFECFNRVFAFLHYQKFVFVHLQNYAFRLLVERVNASNQDRKNQNRHLHFLFLLLGFVLFLNVDTFSACSPADCNLYQSSYYQGCSPTSGNNQYQCGGGSGSCSDVCGGCGWRIRTSGYLQQHQLVLDSLCWLKINASGLTCSRYGSKCTGLRPLRGTFIGLCGVGYESDFDIETICACNDRSSSSSAPSSSSSAPSSSSANPNCMTESEALAYQSCYLNQNNGSTSCGANTDSRCVPRGFTCGGSFDIQPGQNACLVGHRAIINNGQKVASTLIGCFYCPSSSVEVSSSATSSESESSSDSGGGDSQSGQSSSGSGGSGGDGGMIPCGWGDYPPCIVDPIDPPFCELYPELCYEIGGIDDTISRYGSAIADSLGRLIGILDSLDLVGGGSCLDSADCPPGDFSGDSVPFVPGDSSESGSGGGIGSGGVYSWLQSVLSAASIPAAARSCPSFPSVEIELGDDTQILDFDICKEELHIGGYHPLELFGIILRAISCLIAVYVALGAVTSLNAGFHKMRRLGG